MIHRIRTLTTSAAAAAFIAASFMTPAFAQSSPQTQEKSTEADNTKANKRDRNQGAVTADQQKMNTGDRDLTKRIRKAIVDDKSLSTYAHNVKIVSQNGAVTLKGPVHSEDEKQKIESIATEVAGPGKVTNEITIKAEKPTKTKKVS